MGRRGVAAALFVASVVSAVACVGMDADPVVGGNDAGNNDAGNADKTKTDGATVVEPSRGCPLNCLPPAPFGWTGPSAVYEGAPATPSCPKFYSLAEVTAHHLAETAPPKCSCEMSKTTDPAPSCSYSYESYSDTGCQAKTGMAAVPPGCVDTSDRVAFKIATGTVVGACTDPAAIIEKVPPNLDREIIACGLTTASACENRDDCVATPLPLDPPFTRLCIHKDGDIDCPSADYSARVVMHRKIDDTRACPACTGKLTGTCAQSYNFFVDAPAACNTAGTGVVGSCYPSSSIRAFIAPSTTPTSTACSATPSMPTGEVRATDPVTFCCNK